MDNSNFRTEISWIGKRDEGKTHILSDGRLVLGARKSLLDAGGAMLRCRASNRAGVALSRPVLLQPVEDTILSHTIRQLTPAKVGGQVVLRCEVSLQAGLVEVTWLQDGLPLPSGYLGAVKDTILSHTIRQLTPAKVGGQVVLRCEVSLQAGLVEVTWLQDGLPLPSGYLGADARWISSAGGLLLGTDLTQADVQAEYSCLALHTSSQPLRLATDGK
ncbi:hypothetical protein JYU34_012802 [Plutella xylostella]|uniref:Ig-like domain-containing protein n=1 Tax=Plutella xylostella TaxID=51655 RepID=A0ABQ7QD57_PLUXY|nr:hypothetical protein JYU34_012802 [Plutella xylostella]